MVSCEWVRGRRGSVVCAGEIGGGVRCVLGAGEDLGYGAALESRGYHQYVANEVVVDDPYEYTLKRIGPWERYVTEKPTWYQYYTVRNLILLAHDEPRLRTVALQKLAIELGMLALVRDQKLERLGLAARGLIDGALRRSGTWAKP